MSLPYYKRFPRDFLTKTIGLTLEQKGAYSVVLDMIYMCDGRLPDDAQYIAGQLGCSVRKWKSLRDDLVTIGKLVIENGLISNSRADKVLEETRTFRDKQAENRSRPNKNKAVQSPKTDHSEPDTDTDKTIAKAIVGHASAPPPTPEQPKRTSQPRSAARGSRIPANWTPTVKDYAFAQSEGMSREDINREADKFRDHWTATTGRNACKLDWEATWRNWIRSDFRKPGGAAPAKPTGPGQAGGAFDRVVGRAHGTLPEGRGAGWEDPGAADPRAIDGEFTVISSGSGAGTAWERCGSDQADAGSLFAKRRA